MPRAVIIVPHVDASHPVLQKCLELRFKNRNLFRSLWMINMKNKVHNPCLFYMSNVFTNGILFGIAFINCVATFSTMHTTRQISTSNIFSFFYILLSSYYLGETWYLSRSVPQNIIDHSFSNCQFAHTTYLEFSD